MGDIRKILLGGEIGTGKHSLLFRLQQECPLPVAGVRTQMYRDRIDPETGGFQVYMYPASVSPETYPDSDDNYVGACTGKIRKINKDIFRKLGLQLLSDIPEGAVIVMDEIGFFEADVPEYTNRIFEILQDDHPVLGVVKTHYEDPFLTEVLHHPEIHYYEVTEENRESLFEELSAVVKGWQAAAGCKKTL